MDWLFNIFAIIILLLGSIYGITLIIFAITFSVKKEDNKLDLNTYPDVSLLIAFRNEQANLSELIQSILSQNYNGNFEVLLSNDHSTDNSKNIISKFKDERIKVLNIPDDHIGKKSALRYAAKKAKSEILLFTDADCILPKNWIKTMVSGLINMNTDMLCGPVIFKKEGTFLNNLFRLEFMSLTGSGAAGFFINKPFLCNGANFAIKRESYEKAMSHINDKYSSGDDIFLLHYISKNGKADFLKNSDSFVVTNAPENIRSFFNQRIRWASKTTGYKDPFSIYMSLITFGFSLILFFAPIFALINPHIWYLFLVGFLSKTIADKIFLFPVTKFYKSKELIFLVPILQIVYPCYIVTTVILSLFYRPNWKERPINK